MGGRGAGGGGKGGGGGGIAKVDADKLNIEIETTDWSTNAVADYKSQIKSGKKIMPVGVDKTNPSRVVDGNHRAAAYKELGRKVPVMKIDRVKFIQDAAKYGERTAFQMQGWK